MLEHPGELSMGLASWMRGDDGDDAEAAGLIVAETMMMWRKVLESKFRK